jgi:hypothetical protein
MGKGKTNMKLYNILHRLRADSFVKKEAFYCHECDSSKNKVASDDPTTGSFFIVWGNQFQGKKAIRPGTTQVMEEYHPIVFAICKQCLDESGFETPFDV